MGTQRLYRTEGIVLRRRNQGEADRVLTLCTPEGKIDVIAKGARKVRSRKAGHIELFSRSSFVVSRVRNSWDIVSQAETLDAHEALRSDLLRGTHARYALELLDRFFAQGESEGGPALFDLLNHTLTWLSQDDDLDLVARFFEQHLLGLAGFRPELFRCVERHDPPVPANPGGASEPFGFDPEQGGALCPSCYTKEKARRGLLPLSSQALQLLQDCQREPYTRLRGRQIPPTVHAEAERAMQHYITYHLERGVSAGAFLQRIKQERAI